MYDTHFTIARDITSAGGHSPEPSIVREVEPGGGDPLKMWRCGRCDMASHALLGCEDHADNRTQYDLARKGHDCLQRSAGLLRWPAKRRLVEFWLWLLSVAQCGQLRNSDLYFLSHGLETNLKAMIGLS